MTKNISKTLIIGLGGTGQTVIRDIKKRMLSTYGEIPPFVKFLAIDTDSCQVEPQPFRYYYNGEYHEDLKYLIETSEFCQLASPTFDLIEHYPICSEKLNMEELHKLYDFYGLNRFPSRVMGRASLLYNSNEIITNLKAAITSLRMASLTTDAIAQGYRPPTSNGIKVYVIASLAGGMGSSAIMDISRMLQVAGINVDNLPVDCIYGMFFTPSFFEGKPGADYVRVNAYAALSELDYTLGLSDSYSRNRNYTPSSQEIADDRNDYAGYPNDKRVEYFGVYLIDSFTNNGHVRTLEEASRCVASYITCSMASNWNIETRLCLFAHKWYAIEGKYQNYSGLGYGELRFNRQELVRYLLNRKLIAGLETYMRGETRTSVNKIAESFIHENNLHEGVMSDLQGKDSRPYWNELTDAIIARYDRKLTNVSMQEVEPGRDAANDIEASKTRYLTAIGSTIQELIHSFADRKEELFQKLRTMLDERMVGKGFGTFPDLARCLRAMFTDMKEGLEDEMTQHETVSCEMENELHHIQEEIADCNGRGLGSIIGLLGHKRARQLQAIWRYWEKVSYDTGSAEHPTLAWLKVDSARKREAVAIYEEMIRIVDSYYKEDTIETLNGIRIDVTGTYLAVRRMYDGLINLLYKETNRYQPSKVATCETVYADAYFKDYFDKHETEIEALDYYMEEERFERYLSSLFANPLITDEGTLVEMRRTLLGILPDDNLVRRIQEEHMSIDDLIIHCFGEYRDIMDTNDLEANSQLGLLRQLDTILELLWNYQYFSGDYQSIGVQGTDPVAYLFVGVYDTNHCIFNKYYGYDSVLRHRHFEINALGDPDRITFMLGETGIPGHKLKGVEDWAEEFMHKRQDYYPFSDKRLEDIDMIMTDMHAEIAWAYGWLFGLITHPTNRRGLRVKPSHDYVVRNNIYLEDDDYFNYFKNMRPLDIYECHQEFIENQELSEDIFDQAMVLLDSDPIGNAVKIRQWVNDGQMWDPDVRGKQRTTMTPKEIQVIRNEVKYLAMFFDELRISMNKCGMVV